MMQIHRYLEKLQLGDEVGLRFFMTEYGEPLRFFAYKITKNKEVSEEIVSEAFYKLWLGREKAVSVNSIKSFLFLVTRNACYDHTGSSYQKRTTLEVEAVLDREDIGSDILTHIIYTELISQIVVELENLPKQQAEIFRMSYIEGMETDEICHVLDTSASNVYFARSKALSALRLAFKNKDISLYTALITLPILM